MQTSEGKISEENRYWWYFGLDESDWPALALIRGVCIGITNYQVQYYLHTCHMRHKYPCMYVFVCNRMNTLCCQPNSAYTLHLANEMRR